MHTHGNLETAINFALVPAEELPSSILPHRIIPATGKTVLEHTGLALATDPYEFGRQEPELVSTTPGQ